MRDELAFETAMDFERVTVRVDRDTYEWLRQHAADTDRTVSQVLRRSIRLYANGVCNTDPQP